MVEWIYKLTDISSIKRISFRQDINGLRAIAALAVVFYHAELELFKGGWLGVDIFFVISGYLISNIIISELNEGTFSFKNFYLRRIIRILPALFSTLLLTIPFAYFLLTPKAMEEYIDSLVASVFFYANYHFMNLDFYVAESTKLMPLLHTWSLAIEEQYYLLFPLLAFLVYKYFKKYFTFFIGFITIVSLYLNTLSLSLDKFYRLEFRIWELLFGVLVMILSSNLKIKHLEKIGLPLLLFPIFYFGDDWINDTEPKVIALIGISLIIFSNTDSSLLSKVLSFKLISIIGLSSYSIYLLHQPLFAFFRIFVRNSNLIWLRYGVKNFNQSINILEFNEFRVNEFTDLILFSLTIILGFLSYKYIEKSFINNKQYSKLLFSFLFLLSFMILNPSSALDNKGTEFQTNLNDETVFSDYDCWLKYSLFDDGFQEINNCFINNNSNKNLIILGDSSSASISKNIIQNNLFKNYNIYFLSIIYENFFEDFNKYTNCNSCFLTWIQNNPSTIIVSVELHRYIELNGSYSLDLYSNQSVEAFKKNMNYLNNYSNSLFILESFPTIPGNINNNPKDILNNDRLGVIKEIYIPYSSWIQDTQLTTKTYYELENNYNINIVPTIDLFCNKKVNKCTLYKDKLLYLDRTHLSIFGGRLITDKLSSLLEK